MMAWLMSVVLTAFAVSVARRLTPGSREGKLVSLAGGLVLLLALIKPLTQPLDPEELISVGGFSAAAEESCRTLAEESVRSLAGIIEDKTAAYIYDKSRELNWVGTVEVETDCTGSGIPLPRSVTLTGPSCGGLSEWIDRELGIPPERQKWVEGRNGEGE